MEEKYISKLFRGKHYLWKIICEDINSGRFRGDALSLLLFRLVLTPISYELNDTGCGYKIGEEKINHLLYMDDLKLYGKNDKELDGLLRTVQKLSNDNGVESGLDTCEKATLIRED